MTEEYPEHLRCGFTAVGNAGLVPHQLKGEIVRILIVNNHLVTFNNLGLQRTT